MIKAVNSRSIRKSIPAAAFLVAAGITFFSCNYDHLEIIPCNGIVPDTVSFSRDVIPLFNANCNIPGCHSGLDPQGHLNLTDSVAYAQLMMPGSGYIDTVNPQFSVIYVQMNGTTLPMPPTGKLDDCRISLILKWIQQGAKDN